MIALEERRLAADAPQNAQPRGGVGAERGQLADLLALLELPGLEGLDDEAEQEDEHGHADQDDEAENDGRRQQDERNDEVRDDRAGQPRGDVEGAPGAHRVVGHGGDDLAGGELVPDGRACPRRMVRDDLREPERGLQPVGDGAAVPHHACDGLRRTEAEQDERPQREGMVVVVDDAVLDRAPDRERHQRLRHHPADAEEHASDERADLVAPDPQQQPRRRARVGDAGIGDRKPDHGRHLQADGDGGRSMGSCGTKSRAPILARLTRGELLRSARPESRSS